jgi:hypothetical protein
MSRQPIRGVMSAYRCWRRRSCCWGSGVAGVRVVFAMPLDLRANWVFRITPVRGGLASLAARRRALLVLGVLPPWVLFTGLLLALWPWREALGHAAVLGLLGIIAAEIGLHGAQKLPFTCSYLPGKSHFHLMFWLRVGLIVQIIDGGAQLEIRALRDARGVAFMIALLVVIAIAARWWTSSSAQVGRDGSTVRRGSGAGDLRAGDSQGWGWCHWHSAT